MSWRLRVNPITCAGHGLCAELVPEIVALDDWGYPIIDPGPVPDHLVPLARRAVAACPVLALIVEEVPPEQPAVRGFQRPFNGRPAH